MKFLIDQGIGRGAAALLRERGIDATHVRDFGWEKAADDAILRRARVEGRVVVTIDADYHALLALGSHLLPSVIRFRIQDLDEAEAAERIVQLIEEVGPELQRGVAISATRETTRVRRLPLAR